MFLLLESTNFICFVFCFFFFTYPNDPDPKEKKNILKDCKYVNSKQYCIFYGYSYYQTKIIMSSHCARHLTD